MSAELPLDLVDRIVLRRKLLRDELLRARERGQVARLSLNCERKTRAGEHPAFRPGCANDGSGCLCECHDPLPVVAAVSPTPEGEQR